MAVATLTATLWTQWPSVPYHHIGPNRQSGTVHMVSRTLSDIIFLCRVPSGATITDFRVAGTGSGATAAVYKIGVEGGGADTSLITTGDLVAAAGVRMNKGPIRVSRSDTDASSGINVYATLISGTWTVSASFDYTIEYFHDGVVKT